MSHSHRSDDPLQAVKDVVGDSTLLIALAGAVVATLTSFVPFSPLIGGLVAGWLVRTDTSKGALVGGLSGAIVLLPFAFFGFVVFGFVAFDSVAGGIGFLFVLFIFGFIMLFYTVLPAVLGGYLGAKFYQDRVVDAHQHRSDGHQRDYDGETDRWGDDQDDGWGDDDSSWESDDGSGASSGDRR